MNNTSGLRLSEIKNTTLPQVLLAVEESCKHLAIDFYIIGALARDIWFDKEGVKVAGTKDVDFAVFVTDQHQFEQLKERLIASHNFVASKTNAFVLFAPNKIQIDILPFGAIEVEGGVEVAGEGLKRIKVNGFREVYHASVQEVKVLEGKDYKVVTLPGIVLLKLISFDDRPDEREKDPIDILGIIEHFFDLQSDLIYEVHNDLFGNDNDSLQKISARVIGREMRTALQSNEKLKVRIVNILDRHVQTAEKGAFVARMLSTGKYSVQEYLDFLTEIKNGIND